MTGMTVLLLLLWAGVTVSSPVNLQKRIVGGHTCDSATRHYHVYVRGYNRTLPYKCGGSLIHPHWVLTAAHCYQGKIELFLGVHPGQLNLQSGGENFIDYEIYKKSGQPHDLMLVKFNPGSSITPIQLLTDQECLNQAQIRQIEVAGYGPTTLGGTNTPTTLQCGDIPVHSYSKQSICYVSKTVATQGGDSGGGVVYNGKLYGVHVRGYNDTRACSYPSIGMNLCNKEYRDWINKIINSP